MNNRISESLQKGFALTNKSWGILLFGLLFSLPLYFASFLTTSSALEVSLQFSIVLLLPVLYGYWVAIPIFLVQKQQGKSLQFGNLLSVVLQSTKKLFPGILFFLLYALLIGFVLMFIFAIGYGDTMKVFENLPKASREWNFWSMLFLSIFSLFSFTSIYFSLEKNGLFSSLKKSLGFSFKHFNIIAVFILISWIQYSFVNLLSQILPEQLQLVIQTVLVEYMAILLTAISLIFYQNVVKNIKNTKASASRA